MNSEVDATSNISQLPETPSFLAPANMDQARRLLWSRAAQLLEIAPQTSGVANTIEKLQISDAIVWLAANDKAGPDEILEQIGDTTKLVVFEQQLHRSSWNKTCFAALAAKIDSEMVVLFLEPVAGFGWRQIVRSALAFFKPGVSFRSDIPSAMREAGLVMTSVNRFGFGLGGIYSYAIGEARRLEIWSAN